VTARINGPIQFLEPPMLAKQVPDRDFIIPMIAYAYVAFYGLVGHKIGREKHQVAA